jgi:hypothetical protein
VEAWEAFLNGETARQQLMSRYIFEHLFIASLYFDEEGDAASTYRLVRSRTPSGEPIDVIATRRPYDDPGVERFYYRLQPRPVTRTGEAAHALCAEPGAHGALAGTVSRPGLHGKHLPGYEARPRPTPSSPSKHLPVNARYRFMLEEAHFTIMAYIKGPVCRGQVALNVIDDHFWVAFVRPNLVDPEQSAEFLAREAREMRLPQPKGSLVVTLLQWRKYAKSQRRFLRAQARSTRRGDRGGAAGPRPGPDLGRWGGKTTTRRLTVFRHFDSATWSRALSGSSPRPCGSSTTPCWSAFTTCWWRASTSTAP